MDIPCFFIEPTERTQRSLRRYRGQHQDACPVSGMGYHNAETPIEDGAVIHLANGCYQSSGDDVPHCDPRWPAQCACGYVFAAGDVWQVFSRRIYRDQATGEEHTLGFGLRAGAMWYADWYLPECTGPDGRCLCVMTPGGEWIIDSRASNCTRPDDEVHKCWIRQGVPPLITVGKTGGETCSAGAGSILCGSYHGFLRNGVLQSC